MKRARALERDEEEEGERGKRYRLEIGCGKEAKALYERWQALLSTLHKASQIKLLASALDMVERAQLRKRSVKSV